MTYLNSIRNKYKGERIFVVGNGPSLSRTPLDLLDGEYSMAMNRVSLIYEKTEWRPSFFVCTTTNIRKPAWHKDIMETVKLGLPTFAWNELSPYLGDHENVHYLNCTHGSQVAESVPLEWWSSDISVRVCKFGTSMLVALQIAFYLGFDRIYIVGADLGFQYTFIQRLLQKGLVQRAMTRLGINVKRLVERLDRNHFATGYGTPGFPPTILNKNMTAAHRLALAAAEKYEKQIFNATVGGQLEVYPRVDLREVVSPWDEA